MDKSLFTLFDVVSLFLSDCYCMKCATMRMTANMVIQSTSRPGFASFLLLWEGLRFVVVGIEVPCLLHVVYIINVVYAMGYLRINNVKITTGRPLPCRQPAASS